MSASDAAALRGQLAEAMRRAESALVRAATLQRLRTTAASESEMQRLRAERQQLRAEQQQLEADREAALAAAEEQCAAGKAEQKRAVADAKAARADLQSLNYSCALPNIF